MIVSYDQKLNVAYIRFGDMPEEIETREIGEDVVIDVDANGRIRGIELLNASEQFTFEGGKLQLINVATNETKEYAFP
jgi:uncharacterized protein YuzE